MSDSMIDMEVKLFIILAALGFIKLLNISYSNNMHLYIFRISFFLSHIYFLILYLRIFKYLRSLASSESIIKRRKEIFVLFR